MRRRHRITDLNGREVFITGAASGIGRAVAIAAADEGARVHLTDISADGLAATAETIQLRGRNVGLIHAADISDYGAVRAMAEQLTAEYGAMHVVMNVAGIASWGTIQALPHETWRRIVDINLMGPIHVLEELAPPMIAARRGGHIVNVSSAAGIIGLPWHAAYSATKFGLRGVSEVLRFDLERYGIGVSLVCPGGVDTELTETVTIAGLDTTSEQFDRVRAHFRKRAVTPEQAAQSILKGVRLGRYWVYTSPDIRAVHLLQRWFPPGYVLLMRAFNYGANRILPDVSRATRPEVSA